MQNVLVIGATGKIGQQVVDKLSGYDVHVKALLRDPDKLNVSNSDNLEICEADLETDFSEYFQNVDTVVFSAGSGGSTGADKTLLIDLWAARNAVEYAKSNDTRHFIMVSSIGADDPDSIDSSIKPYLVAKHMADEHLINSGVNYTILRPGSLLDDAGTGKVTTERPQSRNKMTIPREDVAEAIVQAILKQPDSSQTFELFSGEEPVEALF